MLTVADATDGTALDIQQPFGGITNEAASEIGVTVLGDQIRNSEREAGYRASVLVVAAATLADDEEARWPSDPAARRPPQGASRAASCTACRGAIRDRPAMTVSRIAYHTNKTAPEFGKRRRGLEKKADIHSVRVDRPSTIISASISDAVRSSTSSTGPLRISTSILTSPSLAAAFDAAARHARASLAKIGMGIASMRSAMT